MNNVYQVMFTKGLSNISFDDLDIPNSQIYEDEILNEISGKIVFLEKKIDNITSKIKNLCSFENFIKVDHEYYLTLDDAIWEQKERRKFMLQDLEALYHAKEKRTNNNKIEINKIKKEIIENTQDSDSLFYFLED